MLFRMVVEDMRRRDQNGDISLGVMAARDIGIPLVMNLRSVCRIVI
jgi:hypothetical protein